MLKKDKLIIGVSLFIAGVVIFMRQLVYNPTPSLQRGYYFSYPAFSYAVNDIVVFCINDRTQVSVMHELKLPHVSGACLYDAPYLMKRVAAVANDDVYITDGGVIINGSMARNSNPLDGYGKLVFPKLHPNKFHLREHEFFVLGQTGHSYDSRYFGIIKDDQIFWKAKLILAMDKQIL